MKPLLKILSLLCLAALMAISCTTEKKVDDRAIWLDAMQKIAGPVLENMSIDSLRARMPVETTHKDPDVRREVTHLEAIGRLLTGIAPWLELGPDETEEGMLREKYIQMTLASIRNGVDPDAADYLNFTRQSQPLVDAAFLAHGLLRAPTQLWGRLDSLTQKRLIHEFKSARIIKPHENNWLLFSAMVECALKVFAEEWEYDRVKYALDKHAEWYKGDGWYGDGPQFHLDYYNSFVIQPMLMQVLEIVAQHEPQEKEFLYKQTARFARYAEQQERLISPEGTYPPVGRSLAYRFGAFYALSDVAYRHMLPEKVAPSQVRSALTAVISRQLAAPGTFDAEGWLRPGFAGHQPSMGENYISTGSLYLCSAVFIALGLPETDGFWADEAADWTQKKVWNGQDIPCDKALKKNL